MSIPHLTEAETVHILEQGGVVLMDTDTLPGFHCRADRPEAVARIASLKGRVEGKPFLVLASSLQQALQVATVRDEDQRQLLQACWPGPFSIILPALQGTSDEVTHGSDSIAVRVPALQHLSNLIREVGFPIVSTSVNREGDKPARTIEAAIERFGDQVDGFHEWAPDLPSASSDPALQPSALIDGRTSPVRVLREGPEPLPKPYDQS